MRVRVVRPLSVLVITWASISCEKAVPPPPPPQAEVITFGVVSGLHGKIAPCGCTSRPLGGLDRIAAQIESERAKGPFALLVVGDTFAAAVEPTHLERQQRRKAQCIAEVLGRLEPWAVLPGLADQGSGMLGDIEKRFALPLFERRDARDRDHLRPDSVVRSLGGLRIAVVGTPGESSAETASYSNAARALRAQGAQFVIGLVPQGGTRGSQFVAGIDGFNVALTGGDREAAAPRVVEQTLTCETSDDGRFLGLLRLHRPGIDTATTPGAASGRALPWVFYDQGQARRRSLQARIERFSEDVATLEPGPARTARQNKLADLEQQLEGLVVEPPDVPYVTWESIPIERAIKPATWAQKILADYDRSLCQLTLEATQSRTCPAPSDAAHYVGNDVCAECHPEALAWWKKTEHAGAWQTLTDLGKECDLECIGCHTTGYEAPGGFCRLVDADAHRDVGCESCHGPASGHVEAPEAPGGHGGGFTGGSTEATCRVCHNAQHSDLFDFDVYRAKVLGPGHGAPN